MKITLIVCIAVAALFLACANPNKLPDIPEFAPTPTLDPEAPLVCHQRADLIESVSALSEPVNNFFAGGGLIA